MTQREVFQRDLQGMNTYFENCGALISGSDESGDYTLIDPSRVPNKTMLDLYRNLLCAGYANGLI